MSDYDLKGKKLRASWSVFSFGINSRLTTIRSTIRRKRTERETHAEEGSGNTPRTHGSRGFVRARDWGPLLSISVWWTERTREGQMRPHCSHRETGSDALRGGWVIWLLLLLLLVSVASGKLSTLQEMVLHLWTWGALTGLDWCKEWKVTWS